MSIASRRWNSASISATVATNLLIGLATNALIQPTYWLDPKNGVNYSVLEQVPQHLFDSVQALGNHAADAVEPTADGSPQLLSNVATITQDVEPAVRQSLQRAARDRR